MAEQGELFYETLTDALRATVDALGGPKVVGQTLWPEKGTDEARRALLDCLNPDRPHQLGDDRLVLLLKMSRAKGIHTATAWIMAEIGYAPPQPVEPEDQMAALQREFIAAVEKQGAIADRIARLGISPITSKISR
jgi:hypothetical protein